ncbi:MAG: peptide transporter [Rhodospirillales bacterium]|nr:peptide transporter [Rhodospirillales bacterium]
MRRIIARYIGPVCGALILAAGPSAAASAFEPGVSLRGLVLVDDPAALRREGWPVPGTRTIDAAHATEIRPGEADRVLGPFLGKPIDMALLQEVRNSLQAYFESIHQPFVSVIVPPQGVDSGVIQVLILVAKLGTLHVTGNEWFDAGQYTDALHVRPGTGIDGAQLDADIDRINRNQYRRATAVASPGLAVGTTDLTLRTKEELPFSFTTGVDNTGTQATTLYRLNAGIDWGNAFWRGDNFNYRYTTAPETDRLQQHGISYSTELPWGDTFNIQGAYSTSNTPASSVIGNSGVTGIALLRYTIPLPAPSWFSHRLVLGYDFKSTNNNILFGGASVFATTSEIDQFQVEYIAQAPDSIGSTSIDLVLVGSPGGLTALNNDAVFESQVPGAKARYMYGRASAERLTDLPRGLTWDIRGTAQFSEASLLPSEQMVFGGYSSVRGFEEQSGTRDNGILVENELRAPPITTRLPQLLGLALLNDQLAPFIFLDYGAGWNHRDGPLVGSWLSLGSIGPGMTYQMGHAVYVRFTWGFPILRQGQDLPRLGPQFAVQFTL